MALGVTRRRAAGASTLITPALLRRLALPEVDGRYGKESRGCVLVVGGSDQIPGAVVLAATAALRAGAGKVQVATSRRVAPWIAVSVPEARVVGLRQARSGELAPGAAGSLRAEMQACDVLLIGPGMVDARAGIELVRRCLRASAGPALIVDAAPLDAFRGRRSPRSRARPTVLTPHAGEMARLCGISREAVLAAPLQIAREAAVHLGVVIALKGARTYVAGPDGSVFHNVAGNDGLGVSGSGDTLSGIIAGLCARGADAMRATVWGVYLHARAGDLLARRIGPDGFLARELLAEIPRLMARLA
jgi:ADP-dependent NAD(P)H-hydrate dehydratase